MEKPNWDNNTNKIQVFNNKDDDAINNKIHALQLRCGKSNETNFGSKKKWPMYNILKGEAEEQLKKYNNHTKLYIHLNDQNGIKAGFVKSNNANKESQSRKDYNVVHDISNSMKSDLQNNFEMKSRYCQTYTPPSFLDEIRTKDNYHDKKSKAQLYCHFIESKLESSDCKRMTNKNNCNNMHINQRQSTITSHFLNGINDTMKTTKELPQPFCKPLLHRMVVTCNFPQAIPHHGDTTVVACHLHANPSPWCHEKICPVHGESQYRRTTDMPQSIVAPAFCDERRHKTSVACSMSITSSPKTKRLDNEVDFSKEEIEESERYVKRFHDEKRRDSWNAQPEKDFKKACEKLCEQIQWKSEKHYQEVARSSFREIVQCQVALHALHKESVESSRGDFRRAKQDFSENNGYFNRVRSCDQDTLSLGQLQSSFSDVTFARPFWECCKERPTSAPIRDRMQRITSPRRSLMPEDLFQRYSMSTRLQVKEGINVACKGIKGRKDLVVPLHPSPSLKNEHFRSKSADRKKPQFYTGFNRRKGEVMPEDAMKKMLNVLPVIMLHRDKTKGIWNRKANQKEWNIGHRGCCSQHWVSVLDNNEKVFHADERKSLSTRASLSPIPKGKFAAMAAQKLKVQGQRCCPHVARSLDFSSPLSSLKAIVNDMSRPQSASLPTQSNSVNTPRFASTCKSGQKPSIIVTSTRKLNNPELNSSTWLLTKMEALINETFTEPKALQIAKEHGIVLDKEDEVALKKFLQSKQKPRRDCTLNATKHERDKTSEKYFNLSNIRLVESVVGAR